KILGTTEAPAAIDTLDLTDYKRVSLMGDGADLSVATMINDKEPLTWKFDETSRKIEVPEDIAVQLLESGAISKGDFADGQKITTASGKKLPSNTFTIAKLQIGEVTL